MAIRTKKRKKVPLSDRCEDCPLHRMLPYVLGEGDGSKLIIIGEAPGREEKRTGRPFVGRAGQVLRGILRGADIDPAEVRITNVVKCRPPDNRTPTKREIHSCLPHLLEEIEDRPDANLLLLGNTALHALTKIRLGITRARGEWTTSKDGRDALPTFHPAYIARPKGARYFNELAFDVQRAQAGPIDVKFTEHEILDTPLKVSSYFYRLPKPVVLAWDLETSGYRAYQDDILAMSLSHIPERGWVITEEMMHNEEVHKILRDQFTRPELRWVGHNAKFDQIFCLQHVGVYPVLYADTMMMHLALDERKGTHDLKLLCRDLLGAPDWEHVLWQYLDNREDTYAKVPRDVLYKYAAYDADFTLRLYNLFEAQLDEDEVRELHDTLLVPASETMMLAEYGGVTVDMDELDEWQWKLEHELEDDAEALSNSVRTLVKNRINELLKRYDIIDSLFWELVVSKLEIAWNKKENQYELKSPVPDSLILPDPVREVFNRLLCWRAKLIDQPFSAGSWQKVGTIVYEVLGLEYLAGKDVRTRGQTYSTSSASLEPYTRDYDVIKRILGIRTKKKLLSTYVLGMDPDDEFRVHPRWKMHATVTGRIGCTDPNVMNIPHEAGTRDFFIASPGHVLVQADYSQAELRILAAYSANQLAEDLRSSGSNEQGIRRAVENAFLVQCYREGRDLHTEVTNTLFGDEWGYDERMIAKAYNFGLVYGRSAKSIAEAFDIPIAEAKAQQRAFFDRMPEVERFLKLIELQVTDPGYITNCFGRRRRFNYVDGLNIGDHKRQARNYKMQSTASDCCLTATVRISNWLREIEMGRVLIFLHDATTIEVPESMMRIAVLKLHDTLLEVPREFLGDYVPFKVDVGVGYGWGQLHAYDPTTGEFK